MLFCERGGVEYHPPCGDTQQNKKPSKMEDSLVSAEGVEYHPPCGDTQQNKKPSKMEDSLVSAEGRISSPLWGHSTKQKAFQNGRLSCERGGGRTLNK